MTMGNGMIFARLLGFAAVFLIATVLLIALASPTAQSRSYLDDLLRREMFSAADLRALGAGSAVAVLIFAVIMGVFFWLLDLFLLFVTSRLTGQGG